jgi:hypothetical protein
LQVLGHHSSQLSPWDCRGFKVWLSEIDLLGSIWGHGFTGGSLADIHFFGWRSQHTWWLLDVMGTIQTAPFKAGELWARWDTVARNTQAADARRTIRAPESREG